MYANRKSSVVFLATLGLAIPLIVICGIYAIWYTYMRTRILERNAQCERLTVVQMPPSPVSFPLCAYEIVPPPLKEMIISRAFLRTTCVFDPHTCGFVPIPTTRVSTCVQSTTTTSCAELSAITPGTIPPPYVGSNIVEPIAQVTTSATNTTVVLDHFSFSLPSGWKGEKYSKYGGYGYNWLFQWDPNEGGFVIDCPPDGKGLEAATILSREDRSFLSGGATHLISLIKLTAPGNEPWFMVFITAPPFVDSEPSCVTSGTATMQTEEAIRELYATWR